MYVSVCQDLTHSKEHSAGPLAAPRPRPAVAKDPSLLRHEVVLEGFDQQVLALRVMPHQQLRVHVAHEEVPAQQGQPHTLHKLWGEESHPIGTVGRDHPSAAPTSPLQTPGTLARLTPGNVILLTWQNRQPVTKGTKAYAAIQP